MPEKMQELVDRVKRALFCLPLVLVAMLASLVACSIQAPITSTNLTPEEAYDLISQQQVTVLDVRIQEEDNSGHIPDALLLLVSDMPYTVESLSSAARVVTFCQTSVRAYQAQRILDGAGFRSIKFMDGSIAAWPYEVLGTRLNG